jgi:hypothetical protein
MVRQGEAFDSTAAQANEHVRRLEWHISLIETAASADSKQGTAPNRMASVRRNWLALH